MRVVPRTALAWTGGLAALLAAGLAAWLAPLEPGPLQLQFAVAPRSFGAIVHLWSPEHLARYRAHLVVDVVLLACLAAFGWLLASRTRWFEAWPAGARRAAAALLPAAAVFGAVQDGLHAWLTAAPRFGLAPLYALAATCAALRWLLLLAFALAALAALARRDDDGDDARLV